MSPLIAVAIESMPALIKLLQDRFAKANPGAPMPTSAQVTAAWLAAAGQSLAVDDSWLTARPE